MTHSMEEQTKVDARLRDGLPAAFPAGELSEGLRERLRALAADAAPASASRKSITWQPLRWGMALAVAGVLAVASVAVRPPLVAAEVLRRMEATLEEVRSAQMVRWTVMPDGTAQKDGATWYQDGYWRVEWSEGGEPSVFRDGKLWTYSATHNLVTVKRQPGPFSYNPSGLRFNAMLKDFTRWGWKREVRVERTLSVDDRPAALIAVEEEGSPERMLFLVDQGSDLPIQMEAQQREGSGWVTRVRCEFRFNQVLPASLFAPPVPPGAKVMDLDARKQRWQERLKKSLGRQRVNDRTVALRDLQVNARGDVFVLFTGGKLRDDSFEDFDLKLEDNRGARYSQAQGAFQPFMRSGAPDGDAGFLLKGEVLHGALFVPAEPQERWRSRRFTISIGVPPVNHHGASLPIGSTTSPTAWAKFQVTVREPTTELIPQYMRYMGVPLDEQKLLKAREEARRATGRQSAFERARQKWSAAGVRATECRTRGDLQGALHASREWLAAAAEMKRAVPGLRVSNWWFWFGYYQTLRDLGRREEALAALRQAREDARDARQPPPGLAEALRREGLE